MLKWFITYDWETPLKKPSGSGEGKNMEEVGAGVKAWIDANMPRLSDNQYCRYVKVDDGKATIIDFGSHTVFARVEGAE